jgi:hypothetical protein
VLPNGELLCHGWPVGAVVMGGQKWDLTSKMGPYKPKSMYVLKLTDKN